jgi:predicted anti-sigma-YlaC factor YlaD
MTCREMDDRIESLAAGDEAQTDETRAHLEDCVRCQAAFARAQQIERFLAARPVPAPPPRFTEAIAAHVRRERWESEQSLDRWFNLMVAACALLAAAGLWLLANVSGMAAVGADAGRLMRDGAGIAADRLARDLPTYVAATGILLSTIAIWLWAERTS